jgi:hypothetical protein
MRIAGVAGKRDGREQVSDVEPRFPASGPPAIGRAGAGLLSLLLVVAAFLVLGASQAAAIDVGHAFSTTFKGSGTNELETPLSVDVDNSNGPSAGDVYVTDSGKHRVEKFDASGNFILMFGDEVNATTAGDVCTAASGNACKAGNSGSSAQQLASPNWIAVDQTSGPSKGDIYVVDKGNNSIHKYDENGNLITSWEGSGAITGINSESFGNLIGVDVDASGNLVTADEGGPPRIWRIDQSGTFVNEHSFGGFRGTSAFGFQVDPSGNFYKANGSPSVQRGNAAGTQDRQVTTSTATTGITIDSTSGTLYQTTGAEVAEYKFDGSGQPLGADNSSCPTPLEEFATSCPPTHTFGNPQLNGAKGAGINAVDKKLYVADTGNHRVAVFIAVQAPIVTTGEPTADKTVSGEVKLDGAGNVTECKFEWGSSAPAYGNSAPCEAGEALPYTSDQKVEATIPALVAEQTYHYRLVAKSSGGGTNFGVDKTITPHNVKGLFTLPAANVARTTAELKASYEGTNETTDWYFEYGLTGEPYEHQTTSTPEGPTLGVTSLHLEVTGLEPEKTYHFRIAAQNSHGPSKGKDLTFKTLPAVTGLTTEAVSNIKPEAADLNASFTGDGYDTEYFFEWGASSLYGNTTPEGEFKAPSGPITIPATTITGLQPLHTYHYRVVAKNSFGTTNGSDLTFTTNSAPTVIAQSSSGVTATEATLHAVINPHGAETEYHFEYGPSTAYGSSAPEPDATIPAGESGVPREVHLTDLNGGVYHFRVVATSGNGTTKSKDQTFNFYPPDCPNASVRQQSGSNSLPDCRAYELVTPEDQGITIVYPSSVPFSATATSPSRLAFVGAYGLIPNSGEPANNAGDTYVSTRTATGWKTKYVGLPSSATSLAGSPPWHLPTGSVGAYEPDKWNQDVLTNQSMSALVDWNDGYFSIGELFEETEHTGSSNAPYVWDTSTGNQIDRWPTNVGVVPNGEHFKGTTAASADLTHFVFTSNIPFAVEGEPGDMYDNNTSTGAVEIASLKENGDHIAGTFPLRVSEDGSRILMGVGTGNNPPPFNGSGELYLRVNDAVTYELAPGKSVKYLDMTPDGKKVYFTTTASLMAEDTDTSRDLYMWDEEDPSPSHLVLISKGNEPTAGNTDACSASWTTQCGVVAITFKEYTTMQGGLGGSPYSDNFVAADNGDIYFLSPEQLHGANGVEGQENLYVYRNGKNQFVAALNPAGTACVATINSSACSENAVARMEVTADDSHMAFLTGSNVTGYDSGGHSEMYEYRPATDEMTCVSCVPSGDPPISDAIASHNGKFMTDDGRTFFETEDALVPQDTNEAGDVYEYVDGRPQLITSGTNVGNDTFGLATLMALPGLVGVSADGTDVFFSTYDALVGQDRNGEAIKIYDARSSGGFQFTPPVPPCVAADECHGPSSSAPAETPNGTGSDLGGSGNVQPSEGSKTGRKAKKPRHKRHHKKKHAKTKGGRRNG